MTQDEVRRLHFIHALFSHVTGNDLQLAHQIKAAITFSLAELETQTAAHPELTDRFDTAFNAAAARLLEKLAGDGPRRGFFHWDAARTLQSSTPLFARAEIMAGLRRLAPFAESMFLVTNLRRALLPPGRRATARRRRDYDEVLGLVRDLAVTRTTRHARMQLLFL
jgi:hypothetical protein